MNTLSIFDRLQVIDTLHGATCVEEFDRVNAKLPKAATPEEIIRRYQAEIMFAKRSVRAWKSEFPKEQRPIQYSAKKELIKVLEEEIIYWQKEAGLLSDNVSSSLIVVNDNLSCRKLSLSELALFLIYTGQIIKRGDKANAIASEEGHNSGDALYNHFCEYSTQNNRTGFDSDTAGKGLKMIKRIENVLPRLTGAEKNRAENEIIIIQGKIK